MNNIIEGSGLDSTNENPADVVNEEKSAPSIDLSDINLGVSNYKTGESIFNDNNEIDNSEITSSESTNSSDLNNQDPHTSENILDLEIIKSADELKAKLDVLNLQIEEFKNSVSNKNEYEHFKDEAIYRMSKQIETYELGFMRKIKESLLKDIILFYDSIERTQEKVNRNPDVSFVENELSLLKEEVEEILFRNDIEKIETPENKFYNHENQKVFKKESTSSEIENNEIVRIFRQGFKIDGRILRKQEVIIKEFIVPTK